ncbi:MAG: DNA/RNA non-specific endonuclease [Bacteroidales bacterium]|nr:DNA/RNA non-specific endonuclease [Bacteroidales bacterium]
MAEKKNNDVLIATIIIILVIVAIVVFLTLRDRRAASEAGGAGTAIGEALAPEKGGDPRSGEDRHDGSDRARRVAATGQPWLELPASTTEGPGEREGLYCTTHYGTLNGTKARNYTILYDPETYASYWVAYPICAAHLGTGRKESWGYDPAIPKEKQTSVSSGYGVSYATQKYSSNSYARGHQIPNADRNGCEEMMAQTYYSTNMTPQLQNGFNGHIWAKLEKAVRDMVPVGDTLYVVTGASFRKVGGNEEIHYITNKNGGTSLPVPNYYWKVVLKVKRDANGISDASAIGFWLPHEEITERQWYDYTVSVDQIEAWTGFDFFANLSTSLQDGSEANTDLESFRSY